MIRISVVSLIIFICTFSSFAQAPEKMNSADIHQSIQKLNFLGSVLYLAAHPDDENTRMISYFSNQVHARTAYLSITRGDGGQNLIGPEIRELLGVIRTNELVQARKVDGGEQFFTRANDFGYSKHPDETLKIWNEQEVLKDVVKIIRDFQPDIIINRFNAESAGKTHGHHTSSAILSEKAFELVADPDYECYDSTPWNVKRLFFNTHWWFYGSRENFDKVDKSDMLWVDTGTYFPEKGLSNSEIASLSRSMHKSQGFGSTGTRGSDKEYLRLLKGEMPTDKFNVFEGIDTSWSRVEGGEEIGVILAQVESDFDFRNPSRSIPKLIAARQLIKNLKNDHWRVRKLSEIEEIILACSGLYLEAVASEPNASVDQQIDVNLEAINRSSEPFTLKSIEFFPTGKVFDLGKKLIDNEGFKLKQEVVIQKGLKATSPYWLESPGTLGMYKVDNFKLIGSPLTEAPLKVKFVLGYGNEELHLVRDLIYKYTDPVRGEVYQPFEILPKVTSSIDSKVIIFNQKESKEIPVSVKAHTNELQGNLSLRIPGGWTVEPQNTPIELSKKGEEKTYVFHVSPTEHQSEGTITSEISIDGEVFSNSIHEIDYDHIPKQKVLLPASSKVVRLNLVRKGKKIAYIQGAGDEVPKYLRQVGYEVTELDPKEINSRSLKSFDALIVGIRAYNTVEELKQKQPVLLDYVKGGGNMIVQYNTNHRLLVKENLAPYPIELSRDRITDENSPVEFLAKDHEVLNAPNKISKDDFKGWVQERGLYFPNSWSKEFTPILSMSDQGNESMDGSLLVAQYGEGYYMYTGLSFFRELPAGVSGAYKLLTNMISIGQNEEEQDLKE